MPLRVAIVGMGNIGNVHAHVYKEHPDAEIVAVCDIIEEKSDKAAEAYGCQGFYSVQKMLESGVQFDAASVTTSGYENSSDHYEPTMQALDAGCHVLGEKPICNEISKAEEMVAKGKAKGVCYGINLNHRFTPAARLARQWVDEGRLGHLLFVNMAMWIMNPAETSPYYHIKSLHPHTVDVMRYFCGDIEAVHCFATKAPGRRIWSTAQFNFRFKNGVVGSLTGSYDIERGHPMERCEVAGTGGRFVLDDMWREVTLYPAGSLQKTVYTDPLFGGFHDFENTFRERIHTFLRQITDGAAPENINGSAVDGLAAQKVLAAAIESLETESVVYVK
jgi:predicted dehydrogenase